MKFKPWICWITQILSSSSTLVKTNMSILRKTRAKKSSILFLSLLKVVSFSISLLLEASSVSQWLVTSSSKWWMASNTATETRSLTEISNLRIFCWIRITIWRLLILVLLEIFLEIKVMDFWPQDAEQFLTWLPRYSCRRSTQDNQLIYLQLVSFFL